MDEEYEFYNIDGDSTILIRFEAINNAITVKTTVNGNEKPWLEGASITDRYIYKELGAVEKIISEFKSLDAFYELDGILEFDDIRKFNDILKKHAHESEQIVDV